MIHATLIWQLSGHGGRVETRQARHPVAQQVWGGHTQR